MPGWSWGGITGPGNHWYEIDTGSWEVNNDPPYNVPAWSTLADPYITGISVTNPGNYNTYTKDDLFSSWTVRLPGDVVVGFLKPLHESFDGPNFSNQEYFMIVNSLCPSVGTAYEARQQVRLTFNFGSSGITSLQRMRRSDGLVETVPLVSDGNNVYHLDLILDGGTGDLFKYNTGAPFVGSSGL